MYIIWILIVGAAISGVIEGFTKARRKRNQRREYEKYKYNPYTTRGFNTLYVFESNGSFCVSGDPEYYLHSSPEEDFELPIDLPPDEYHESADVCTDEEEISSIKYK